MRHIIAGLAATLVLFMPIATFAETAEIIEVTMPDGNVQKGVLVNGKFVPLSPTTPIDSQPTELKDTAQVNDPLEPQFSEFKASLPYATTVGAAIFGARKRKNKEIEAYWDEREKVFNQELASCKQLQSLSARLQCYTSLRQVENSRTENQVKANSEYNRLQWGGVRY